MRAWLYESCDEEGNAFDVTPEMIVMDFEANAQ